MCACRIAVVREQPSEISLILCDVLDDAAGDRESSSWVRMKSSSAASSSQPDAFQRVESVSEAEPTHSSNSVSESVLISEAERVPRCAAEAVVGKLVSAVETLGNVEGVVLKAESVPEAEPTQASNVFSAHAASELVSEAELDRAASERVSEAELGHESDPVSEEEPAHAGATVKPAQTSKLPIQYGAILKRALLGWVIATKGTPVLMAMHEQFLEA
jgi:hypothetical protein